MSVEVKRKIVAQKQHCPKCFGLLAEELYGGKIFCLDCDAKFVSR